VGKGELSELNKKREYGKRYKGICGGVGESRRQERTDTRREEPDFKTTESQQETKGEVALNGRKESKPSHLLRESGVGSDKKAKRWQKTGGSRSGKGGR